MKRVFALGVSMLLLLSVLTSCSGKQEVDLETSVLVTVETSDKKSYLNYYNADADIKSSVELDVPKLGTFSNPAVVTQGNAYMISELEEDNFVEDRIFKVDVLTGEATALPLSALSIYTMYAKDDIVYTITGIDYVSTLTRFDTKTGEKKEFKLDGFGMKFVYAYENTVVLLASEMLDDVYATMYFLDEQTLELKKKYDVKEHMFCVNDMLMLNGTLYIAPLTKLNEKNEEVFISNLICFDLEKEEFRKIATKSEYPCQRILQYSDGIVISHTNPIQLKGHDITVYNLNTNKLRTKTVDSPTAHLQVKDNRLYQLSEESITVFDLSKANFQKIKTVDNSIRDGYKTTTFFTF